MQPALAQTYAGLVPPLVYLADDMVRDADPQVSTQIMPATCLLLISALCKD